MIRLSCVCRCTLRELWIVEMSVTTQNQSGHRHVNTMCLSQCKRTWTTSFAMLLVTGISILSKYVWYLFTFFIILFALCGWNGIFWLDLIYTWKSNIILVLFTWFPFHSLELIRFLCAIPRADGTMSRKIYKLIAV